MRLRIQLDCISQRLEKLLRAMQQKAAMAQAFLTAPMLVLLVGPRRQSQTPALFPLAPLLMGSATQSSHPPLRFGAPRVRCNWVDAMRSATHVLPALSRYTLERKECTCVKVSCLPTGPAIHRTIFYNRSKPEIERRSGFLPIPRAGWVSTAINL